MEYVSKITNLLKNKKYQNFLIINIIVNIIAFIIFNINKFPLIMILLSYPIFMISINFMFTKKIIYKTMSLDKYFKYCVEILMANIRYIILYPAIVFIFISYLIKYQLKLFIKTSNLNSSIFILTIMFIFLNCVFMIFLKFKYSYINQAIFFEIENSNMEFNLNNAEHNAKETFLKTSSLLIIPYLIVFFILILSTIIIIILNFSKLQTFDNLISFYDNGITYIAFLGIALKTIKMIILISIFFIEVIINPLINVFYFEYNKNILNNYLKKFNLYNTYNDAYQDKKELLKGQIDNTKTNNTIILGGEIEDVEENIINESKKDENIKNTEENIINESKKDENIKNTEENIINESKKDENIKNTEENIINESKKDENIKK